MRIVRPLGERNSESGAKVSTETKANKASKSEFKSKPRTKSKTRPKPKPKLKGNKGNNRTERIDESSDLKIESDDSARRRRKTNQKRSPSEMQNSGFAESKPADIALVAAKDLKLNTENLTELAQLPDGRKRRRSEFSELSFFNAKAAATQNENNEALSDDDLAELFEPLDDKKKEFNRLLASGMRLLAMREHSVKEVATKLLAKTELTEIAYAVVDQLLEDKYLSNERFAESFVRSRMNKGFGPVKIRSELKNKGITNHLIAEYLDMTSGRWFDIAREQYDKKYGELSVDSYNEWTKRARFLQNRGFTMEHIQVTLPEREFN